MEIFLLLFKIIFLLFFAGYGFTAIFIPEKLRRDAFWMIPWFGLIFISVIGVFLSMAGVPMNQAKYLILALALVLVIYAFITNKKISFVSWETGLITLLTIVCLLFNLWPLIKVGFPTTISLGNLDPISYVHTSDFLINHTVFDGKDFIHYKPYLWATGDLLHNGFRWGTPMILSFFTSIFGLKSYQIYSILITIIFALSFPITYILAKQIINRKKSYLLLFLIFLTQAFNSTNLYMLYHVFFAQFIFLGVFITIIILLHSYFSEENINLYNFNSYDFLTAFSLSSLTTLYVEGLFFIFIPLFIFIFLKLLQKKYWFLLYGLKIILLLLVINPTTFGNALRVNYKVFISTTKIGVIGWEKIRYAKPMEIIGFYNLYHSRKIPYLAELISSVILMGIMIIGYFKSKQKLFVASFMGFFVFLYLIFALYFKNFFTYHRTITYTVFFISILFSSGMLSVFDLLKNKVVTTIIIVIFTLMSIRSSYRTMYQLYWHPKIVDKSLISLTELNNNKSFTSAFYTSDVFLGEYDLWKRLWREYLLTDKYIVTRQNYPTERIFLEGMNLVLSEKNYLEGEGKKIVYKNIVWENEYYQLGEIKSIKVAKDLQKY
ncbi:MAG: hypothetical protein AAB437_00120 [Patescibacteria group bacterium]